MNQLQKFTNEIEKFRKQRDWGQFHNFKDLALSLVLEAGEVMEHFQWKGEKEMKEYAKKHAKEVGEELADVLYWVLLISHDLGLDLEKAFYAKMAKNAKKYPVKKAKGNHLKYTQLSAKSKK